MTREGIEIRMHLICQMQLTVALFVSSLRLDSFKMIAKHLVSGLLLLITPLYR